MVICFGSILLMMVQSRGCKMLQRRHSRTREMNLLVCVCVCERERERERERDCEEMVLTGAR